MGNLVFVLGKPGTGKSFSLRNFSPDELGVLNVQGKILPFKGSGKFEMMIVMRSLQESKSFPKNIRAL